ncbi:amino acid ABC transporter permease [Aureimonas pseudogalii]|uniref:Polar amino acid transport system permease protein n=1 Tax=Aureimonas pseudogalii TaxID=1744844 RepID=A0A7W6MLL7_9HYPH|nr:amino acid ABC transporter permease [Aureimonas pseudogalii]MBB3999928.1 polar amino acid transport system permease protein [Aureimonas pseudogalii]
MSGTPLGAGSPGLRARLRAPDFPWWLVALGALALGAGAAILGDAGLRQTLRILSVGLGTTVLVTAIAFGGALALGLLVALAGRSRHRFARNAARLYVEIVRGVPVLVLLFWIAFAGAPGLVAGWNWLATPLRDAGLVDMLMVRDVSLLARAVIALVVAYSAFVAEILRAGIEAVPAGQVEAAKALGLGPLQRFRLVILPQAIRTVLPPLGNDLVAMVKDSSLVSVLGVADVTQMGKVYASGSFRFFETYSVVAYLYLLMTVSLSLGVRALERRLRRAA